ncbi:MAG: DNA repair protein RecO [Firmicutes bacterium]|nr:DNA repair protein RecO [Bacillota bacterium]
MQTQRVQALVLTSRPWQEAHRLVDLLTRERGLVRAIAYDAQKPQKPLSSVTQVLTECNLLLGTGDGELGVIIQGTSVAVFQAGATDPTRLAYALAIAEMIVRVAADEAAVRHDLAAVYDDCKVALRRVLDQDGPLVTVSAMMVALFPYAGLAIDTERCGECGTPHMSPPVRFRVASGSGVCRECASQGAARTEWPISEGAWRVLRHLAPLSPVRLGRVHVKPATEQEVCRLLSAMLSENAGISLRGLHVAQQLDPRFRTGK